MIPSMPDSTWADGGIAITKSKMSKRVLSKLAFGNYPMLSQNDVCMTKRGCDDACANLIRSGGDDDEEDDTRLLTTRAPPVVAVTTPETEALSSSGASEDNTAATTSMCCNGGSTNGNNLVTVEYGGNEAVA